jgi:hypothetical protein
MRWSRPPRNLSSRARLWLRVEPAYLVSALEQSRAFVSRGLQQGLHTALKTISIKPHLSPARNDQKFGFTIHNLSVAYLASCASTRADPDVRRRRYLLVTGSRHRTEAVRTESQDQIARRIPDTPCFVLDGFRLGQDAASFFQHSQDAYWVWWLRHFE